AKPDGRAVSEFPDGLRRCAESCLFYPAHVGPYPSVSICSSRSMALRTSSRMVSIFSSALFLAFSLGGFSFGGAFCSIGSVGSVLVGAGFGSVGLVSVEVVLVWLYHLVFFRLVDSALCFCFIDLSEGVSYDVSFEVCDSKPVAGLRDIGFCYRFPDRVGYGEGFQTGRGGWDLFFRGFLF